MCSKQEWILCISYFWNLLLQQTDFQQKSQFSAVYRLCTLEPEGIKSFLKKYFLQYTKRLQTMPLLVSAFRIFWFKWNFLLPLKNELLLKHVKVDSTSKNFFSSFFYSSLSSLQAARTRIPSLIGYHGNSDVISGWKNRSHICLSRLRIQFSD